jgi:hypothetical protein
LYARVLYFGFRRCLTIWDVLAMASVAVSSWQ